MARRAFSDLVPALPVLGLFEKGRTTPLRLGIALALAMLGLRLSLVTAFGQLRTPGGDGSTPVDLREARIGLAEVIGSLAYEARIEAVREWPFDVPTLVRFAAFLLLPLGSWLGGALVERVVSGILG